MLASSTISTTSSWIVAGVALAVTGVLVLLLVLNRRDRRRLAATTEQLAASEARMRELAETVPSGIFQTDAEGKVLYANPRLVQITADPSADVLMDRPWMIHEDDEPLMREAWAKAAAEQTSCRARFRIRRTNGEIRWVSTEARPIVHDGEIAGWVGSVVDVTEETQALADLRRFSEILEATPDLVAMVDTNGCFTYANAAARLRFGITDDDSMQEMRAIDVYAPTARALFFGEALPTANRVGVWSGEVELLLPDGSEVPVSQVVVAHRRPDGSIDYYSSITRDISERRVLEEQLAQAGLYDPLTGLPNRAVFLQVLGDAMDAALHAETQIAVLLLDLDHFKLVNDSFGHDSGDLMLRLVTQRLQGLLGPGDVLARFGSDVFCLLATDVAGEGGAVAIAEQINDAMATPFSLDGDQVFLSMSIGIALSSTGDVVSTPETILRDSDLALHRAKDRGGARTELFVEDFRAHAVNRLRTANDLHRALTNKEFRVVYQPEVDLRTGHITGVEALVRWHHPERGLVPPGEFIPLAEQTGLIAGIGEYVLDASLAQAVEWRNVRHDGGPLIVWVNLSARQLGDPGLVDLVDGMLRRHGVEPSQLGLEITESALLEDAEGAVTALSSLRGIGVRLAVDDFGTGYSSLSYLKRLPVDAVKIDRTFVDGLAVDGDDSAIVAAVAGMARALRLVTIAEGVESLEQLHALRRLGCDLAQGFFFTTPQPPAHITRLLESDRMTPMFAYEEDELSVRRAMS
ncbi:MAG TPA: EAL domain-containing protein [Mycobacteriales bacterium]|jgi:diguanylate cyclase (GGDEF)-like protein/PAS domain S-box-containing protein|nr:EAL domain-containing protein [Mycobacteriales bacterium]